MGRRPPNGRECDLYLTAAKEDVIGPARSAPPVDALGKGRFVEHGVLLDTEWFMLDRGLWSGFWADRGAQATVIQSVERAVRVLGGTPPTPVVHEVLERRQTRLRHGQSSP